jgi:hypothetical protein
MRLGKGRDLAVALAIACVALCGCGSAHPGWNEPHSAYPSSDANALQDAVPKEPDSTYTVDPPSCRLTDALTVFSNVLAQPVRLASAQLQITGGATSGERVSASITAYYSGQTDGLFDSTNNPVYLRGKHLVPVSGAVVDPYSSSGRIYELVFRIDVLGVRPTQWFIESASVQYTVGGQSYTVTFPQSVTLPPTTCPS